jgi:2-polyprenyl-6-methoxyphenol hydroxylase-like FAD-dependent oxidoreductase
MTKQPHAEIAGAGLSGLATATVLAQHGWTVAVHERNPELREIGAGIGLWQNGLWALRQFGAHENAVRNAVPVDGWEIYDEKARCLQREWMAPGVGRGEAYTILRTDLHRALVSAAREAGVEIHAGEPVKAATPDGELLLEDGQVLPADLVVGADGCNSKVRESLRLALRVEDMHDGCGRHLIERLPEDRGRILQEHWNGARRVGLVGASAEHVYVYLCCPEYDAAGRDQVSTREPWIRSFPHLRDALERISDSQSWYSFSEVVSDSWSSGRSIVVGDAAHAMAPSLGQAINVAFCNAVALGQALELYGEDIPNALRVWEHAQRPVTDATQRSSRFYGSIGTSWPHSLPDLRSALVWGIGKSPVIQRRINPALRHRPDLSPADGSGRNDALERHRAQPESDKASVAG